jgi:hypothetical protein
MTDNISERKVEKLLVDGIKKLGGIAYKFVSPGNDGVPDRICILPGGHVIFVELKTDSGKVSPMQLLQLERLQRLKAVSTVLYGTKDVERFLKMQEILSGTDCDE